MPEILVAAILILAVAIGWYGVARLTRSVRHTSLTAASAWAAWFQTTLTITTIATVAKSRVPPGILDQLWYLTAVSALCPFVAVLGARRGRLVEWSFFIVLPLIAVLEWPAIAQLTRCWHGQRLELEMPALMVFGLILFMGAGNFAGRTRFVLATSCWIVMWSSIVGSFKGFNLISPDRDGVSAFFAVGQLFFWCCVRLAIRRQSYLSGWDRVWRNFQDWFGAVWAARIMARFNEVAEREQWLWRLTHEGLQLTLHDAPHPGSPIGDPRVDQTFRWLLKPFVDPEWIDERLTASTDRASGG